MLAYILSNKDLKIKDILEFEEYDFKEDIDYADKSFITVAKKPDVSDDDFVFCKDGNNPVFTGICETFKSDSDDTEYSISLLQKENLFDRQIFLEHEDLIRSDGIEDFIVKAVEDNFTASGDTLMDKRYISIQAVTHTPVAAKVDTDKGIYNLKTYLGNAKQYYGIYVDFAFSSRHLEITIHKKEEPVIPIDIEVSDISDYTETYSVDVLAKLAVKWKIPDVQNGDGSIAVGDLTHRQFFLLVDRTISQDINDPNRASGVARSVYIEAKSEDEMLQAVYNEFKSNQYKHKISFSLKRGSKLYPEERFYVGRNCTIKTKTGVRVSMITKSDIRSDSAVAALTFGSLKVTLIEKLRRDGRD